MNQQVKPSTQAAPQAGVTPPEITALGSQETVAASIGQIFDDPPLSQPPTESISPVVPIKETIPEPEQIIEIPPGPTVEVNADSQQIETAVAEASTSSPIVEVSADNPLTNPREPVIEEESPPLHDPATLDRLRRDVREMIKKEQFAGAEIEVTHERIENTKNISLS